MNKERLLVSNIQRFSLHDGPGIRTTVFLMGCPLRCPWCANPENQRAEIQSYVKDGRKGSFGRYVSSGELIEECLKDKAFYCPGGVTFSGGEPLLQMDALLPVCEGLHTEGVHLTAETSLFVSREVMKTALSQIDLFLVDVKILEESRGKEVLGGDLSLFLDNLGQLMQTDKQVILRIPVIAGYTDDRENQEKICALIDKYRNRIEKVELLEGHRLGAPKYRALGRPAGHCEQVPLEQMQEYFSTICELGVPTELWRI